MPSVRQIVIAASRVCLYRTSCFPCVYNHSVSIAKQNEATYHETRLDDPQRICANRAGSACGHSRQDMQRPRVFSHHRLVSFDLGSGVYSIPRRIAAASTQSKYRFFSKCAFDTVIHRKVNGPSRKISKDGRTKSAIKPSKPIVCENST